MIKVMWNLIRGPRPTELFVVDEFCYGWVVAAHATCRLSRSQFDGAETAVQCIKEQKSLGVAGCDWLRKTHTTGFHFSLYNVASTGSISSEDRNDNENFVNVIVCIYSVYQTHTQNHCSNFCNCKNYLQRIHPIPVASLTTSKA